MAAAARHYLVRLGFHLMDDETANNKNKRRNFPRKKLSQTFDKYLPLIVYRGEPPIMDPPSEVSITGHAIRYRAAGRGGGGGEEGGLTMGCLGQIRNIWRNRNKRVSLVFFVSQLVKRRKYNFGIFDISEFLNFF